MSNDYFRFRQFTVYQSQCAMKVGTDGTLLGAWATLPATSQEQKLESTKAISETDPICPRILDIGTGTGLVAMMMAQRYPEAEIWGIDIDADATKQATDNVAQSRFANQIHICQANINQWEISDEDFDAIVSNPPYFNDALTCPDCQRTTARHTESMTYTQLMKAARRLLNSSGTVSIIIPDDCRSKLETAAILEGFFIQRICAVRTTPRKNPKRFLLQFGLHSTPLISTELVMGSKEYQQLTQAFYLSKQEKEEVITSNNLCQANDYLAQTKTKTIVNKDGNDCKHREK